MKMMLWVGTYFLLNVCTQAQVLDSIDPGEFTSQTVAIMKFEKIGKECSNKRGKAIYCDGLVKEHDKNSERNILKQEEISQFLKFDYNIITYAELQEDRHSDSAKYRFYVNHAMQRTYYKANDMYEYHFKIWDSKKDLYYEIELGHFFEIGVMASYKVLVTYLNEFISPLEEE